MAKPKFDYNGDAFYDEIEQLAKQGQKDSEIAYALGLKFGVDLNPQVFNRMKNGKYENWNEDENAERGERITQSLVRGREFINAIVRGRYLKCALGGVKVKGKTTTKRHMVVDGVMTDDIVVETRETEQETPPNIQALSTWLFHYDMTWREIQRGKKDEEEKGIPFDPKKGISVNKWIEREIEQEAEEQEEDEYWQKHIPFIIRYITTRRISFTLLQEAVRQEKVSLSLSLSKGLLLNTMPKGR